MMKQSIAYAALFCFALVFGAAAAEQEIQETYRLGETGTLSIENTNGNISIEGRTGTGSVEMKATKTGRADQIGLVTIDVEQEPGVLRIRTRYPKHERDLEVKVHYTLTVPAKVAIDKAKNVNGNVKIAGVDGPVDSVLVNGNLAVIDARSSVNCSNVNGRVEVNFAEIDSDERFTAETVNGGVTLRLPADVGAQVEASSLNGSIRSDFPILFQGGLVRNKMSGSIGSGKSEIRIKTVNGSIELLKN